MTAFFRYTLSRMAIFAIAVALLSLAGMNGLWLLLAALVLSSIASIFLLGNQRAALADEVAKRVNRDQSPE